MESLFSYGTLRDESVQRAVFGHTLDGVPDAILGYRLEIVTITDPQAIAISGHARHPILMPTGQDSDQVQGTVLGLTGAELLLADGYEDAAYKRVKAPLRSGSQTWVYVQAKD